MLGGSWVVILGFISLFICGLLVMLSYLLTLLGTTHEPPRRFVYRHFGGSTRVLVRASARGVIFCVLACLVVGLL